MQSKQKQTKCEHSRRNSKKYLKRRYRIRYWIPMFIGTPCRKIKSYPEIFYFWSNKITWWNEMEYSPNNMRRKNPTVLTTSFCIFHKSEIINQHLLIFLKSLKALWKYCYKANSVQVETFVWSLVNWTLDRDIFSLKTVLSFYLKPVSR